MHTSVRRLQQFARQRAERQARRIPWPQLYESRNQYIEWQEFFLWARSIIESEGSIPDWLAPVLDDRCPGFLDAEHEPAPKATNSRPLALRLEDWIDEHAFAVAKEQGWFDAITYHSVRDPRYQRAEVCWSECVEKWRRAKPVQYPSFEDWKGIAAECDETSHLLASERKARLSSKLVSFDRLGEAVARYMDYEALAYWARAALERYPDLPTEVVSELERRCPGFLNGIIKGQPHASRGAFERWQGLMLWIADHFFQDAKAGGWFDAILVGARNHPRAIRSMEYADHCDEVWSSQMPEPYPSFEDWRRDADAYVDLDD